MNKQPNAHARPRLAWRHASGGREQWRGGLEGLIGCGGLNIGHEIAFVGTGEFSKKVTNPKCGSWTPRPEITLPTTTIASSTPAASVPGSADLSTSSAVATRA